MRPFWKRTNRGLWLGLALLVVLLAVIIIGEIRFRMEKPKINQLGMDYLSDLLQVNAQTGDAVGGTPLTEEQKKAQSDALEAVILKYWYQGETDVGDEKYRADDLRDLLKKWQKDAPCVMTDLKLTWMTDKNDFYIGKDGPNRAVFHFLVTASATVHGGKPLAKNSVVLFPAANLTSSDFDEIDIGDWTMEGTFSVQLELERRGKDWKVVGMSSTIGSNYTYGGYYE